MDFLTIIVYLVLIVLRIVTWIAQERVQLNMNLNIANFLYGFNTLFLTFRAFGQIMESKRRMGIIQISLLKIVKHIFAIFWQFAAAILAFSFAITKVFEAERSFMSETNVKKRLVFKKNFFFLVFSEEEMNNLEVNDHHFFIYCRSF